jgi:hypothetical protein
MINIVTGPPRSGKSYFITHWIWKNYLTFDKDRISWKVKNDALIISNVDGWIFPHKNLDEILRENDKTPEQFFTIEVQQEMASRYDTILYIIDEAHKYFPLELGKKSIISKGLRDYFAYHGHFNQHFWLATQDVSLIFPSLVKLAETEYQTVRSSISPPGRFRYHLKVPGKSTKIGKIVLRKDKKVYALYRTADKTETEKPVRTKAYLMLYCAVGLMVVIISLFVYKISSFGESFRHNGKKVESVENKKIEPDGKIKNTTVKQSSLNKVQPVKSSPGSTQNTEPNTDTMSWQKVFYVLDHRTNKMKVYDPTYKEFVNVDHYEHPVRVINRSLFAYLETPKAEAHDEGESPESVASAKKEEKQ